MFFFLILIPSFVAGFRTIYPRTYIPPMKQQLNLHPIDLLHHGQTSADISLLNFNLVSQFLAKYQDEPDPIEFTAPLLGLSVLSLIGGFLLFSQLGKSVAVSQVSFTVTEQEQTAIDKVSKTIDPIDEDRLVTEGGTIGAKKRKEIAEKYISEQRNRSIGNTKVRGKTLTYAEINFEFLATLLRSVNAEAGGIFLNVGSGIGRASLLASTLYPFRKCINVEINPELHNLALKLLKNKSKFECVNQDYVDFADESIASADVIFAYSTYFSSSGQVLTELSEKLSAAKAGARIITIDRKLSGPFKLITTVDDPRGDLQLYRGYVWEKI